MTFWSLCLTCFFLLLRKSNVVVDSLTNYDLYKILCQEDIEFYDEGTWVTLRWSKTNQVGHRLVFLLPSIPGLILCPVAALKHMWGLVGPCFRGADGRPFSYYQFMVKLRNALALKGYPPPPTAFSAHSFLRGGCTFCFLCGVPTPLIKLLGGWSSDCFYRYLEFPMEARKATTDLMKHRIQLLNW